MNKSMEYEVRKRVDVEYDEDILRLAGIEAAKLGISRRRYLEECVIMILKGTKDMDRKPYKVEEI